MIHLRKVLQLPFIFALSVLLLISGCTDPEFEKANVSLQKAEVDLKNLEVALSGARASSSLSLLPNLIYLKQYASAVRRINPSMEELIATLEQEGSVKGGSYQFLKKRYENTAYSFLNDGESSRAVAMATTAEATAVSQAAKPVVFNDSLIDVINVLADMSKGELPKLKFGETKDKTMPPTQHLVGNPRYGGWGHGSGGSLWVWYGQYRLFSDVLGWGRGYRYNQDSWYRSRSGSYYGDIGRHYYGTNRNNRSWKGASRKQPNIPANKASQSTLRSFKSTKRLSTYAPRTARAPKSMAKTYAAKNVSSYSNARSSPSRSGGFGGRSGGK
ncbi:hypothetical protein A9Q83_00365 [Alphaproteobacteria bacterium 46_93_T64]|nr:hypothetical protein A9Q83_00365 [Alphaproteobacteria bacterium 46_93_T64]